MIDIKQEIFAGLNECGIPVYYEALKNKDAQLPYVLYSETGNSDLAVGDTLEYADISIQVKVMTTSLLELVEAVDTVDTIMKGYKAKLTGSAEYWQDGVGHKALNYSLIGYKKY